MFFSICPVPRKQIPVNEYRDLKERMFFHWAILEDSKYAAKLLAVWVSGLLIAAFLIAGKSVSRNITYVGFYWSAILAKIAVLLCLMQLYTAWHYLYLRLMNQKIAYKLLESSKTAVWYKPESTLIRDRLIARFQVRPVLKRIKQTILLVLLFLILNFSILFLTLSY
ncbi:MAG: CGLD27 family protein [Cyanobacteria bacterium J06628_3]